MPNDPQYKGMSDHDLLVTIATKQDVMHEDVVGLQAADEKLHTRIDETHSRINRTNDRVSQIKIAVGSIAAIGLIAGTIAGFIFN